MTMLREEKAVRLRGLTYYMVEDLLETSLNIVLTQNAARNSSSPLKRYNTEL